MTDIDMTEIDTNDVPFEERVPKGLALLEEFEPGCTDRIDTETLNLRSHRYCAVAQAIGDGDFYTGRAKLGIAADNDDATAVYGFSLTNEENFKDQDTLYFRLRKVWIAELTKHRNAKAAAN